MLGNDKVHKPKYALFTRQSKYETKKTDCTNKIKKSKIYGHPDEYIIMIHWDKHVIIAAYSKVLMNAANIHVFIIWKENKIKISK